MTAAGGIVHEEFHGPEFARRGGPFEMVQLWVNLPARHKMAPPRYQSIVAADIPSVAIGEGGGTLRVIAGTLAGPVAPARRRRSLRSRSAISACRRARTRRS